MAEPRHRTIDVRGLPIHLLEWGEPNAVESQPLVLVHGFLDQAYSWNALVQILTQKAARPLWIVAPDCRGHGDSGWVGNGGYYHFPDYVFDLDCVIRSLDSSRCKLIGHSMGGTISFLYAGAYPEKISRLVLIEGVGPPAMTFSDAPTRMAQWISEIHQRGRGHFRQYTSVEAGAAQLRQTNSRLSDDLALELARAGMKQNDKNRWVWKFDPLHRTAAPQPFYTAQALEFLRRITCPVLIVEGKESHQTKRADKQERYDAIRDHRHSVIAGAGHMVHQDNPSSLADVLLSFLDL